MDKNKIGALFSDAGKAAKDLLDKSKDFAIHKMDQNADGKFDMEDISSIAESVGDAVKKSAQSMKESAEERSRQLELKTLQPFFPETLDSADFLLPKLIRVTERDKKHAESEVCKGSIGYMIDQKEMRIVNMFSDSLDAFGMSFYPDADSEYYYIDPTDRDTYIALDNYFSYLKTERINELQRLAQELGAKHFKVTYKEEQFIEKEKNEKTHTKAAMANTDVARKESENRYSKVEIAAEMECPGHKPVQTHLKYLQRDPNIQNLLALRMSENAVTHLHYMLQMSLSSGIKESDAIKIDAVLKGMKYGADLSIASEARNESRKYLEYEIDF